MEITTTLSVPSATATAPIIDPQNLQNNLFTDLAPLLALFGDEITKQFLSTSVGWADNILLGLAPIGVLTVIMCAIRIGGPDLLRAFIGRARESADDKENELLSSTSPNVREIWDGRQILRQVGGIETVELVYDTKANYKSTSICSLVDALKETETKPTNFRIESINGRTIPRRGGPVYNTSSVESQLETREREREVKRASALLKSLPDKPPNLTLNVPKAIPGKWKIQAFTALGFFVQAIVMIINALTVYRWKWLRGTVIEASTKEYTLGPCLKKESRFHIVRWQKKIPHLSPYAYAIVTDSTPSIRISERVWPPVQRKKGDDTADKWGEGGERDESLVHSSLHPLLHWLRRMWDWILSLASTLTSSNSWVRASGTGWALLLRNGIRHSVSTLAMLFARPISILIDFIPELRERLLISTVLGTFLTLAGFVCQNIGIRELHWSAGVLQLGATLILALCRALLQGHTGDPPEPKPLPLHDGHEASQLAFYLEKSRCSLFAEIYRGNKVHLGYWGRLSDEASKRMASHEFEETSNMLTNLPARFERSRMLSQDIKELSGKLFSEKEWGVQRTRASHELDETPGKLTNPPTSFEKHRSPSDKLENIRKELDKLGKTRQELDKLDALTENTSILSTNRMLNSVLTLSSFNPNMDLNDIVKKTARGVRTAIEKTFDILNLGESSSEINWLQDIEFNTGYYFKGAERDADYCSLKDSGLEGSISYIYMRARKSEGKYKVHEETCKRIEGILALSMYNLTGPQRPELFAKYNKASWPYMRIIGRCKGRELEERKAQLRQWLGPISSLKRDSGTKITDLEYGEYAEEVWFKGRSFSEKDRWGKDLGLSYISVFVGLKYSSVFKDRGTKDLPENSEHELVSLSSPLSLLQILAFDILASFLLDLASSAKQDIQDSMNSSTTHNIGDSDAWKWRNGLCDDLAEVLIEQELCSEKADALITIIPAFIAQGIHMKPMEPLPEKSIAQNVEILELNGNESKQEP